LIEHELGRRIAALLLRELKAWMEGITSREPVQAFKIILCFHYRSYIKEDIFINRVEEKGSISSEDNERLLKHYEN
jgi:hypothetical protein